jgi:hypothetical protein
VNRTGLGRHDRIEENAGDPLDGLVNLFDIGMVLAVAFLIAGLMVSLNADAGRIQRRPEVTRGGRVLPNPAAAPTAHGRGEAVGKVYRLADGRLVYVKRP